MDLQEFLKRLIEENEIRAVMTNPFAQFGIQPRNYLGAEILPEQTVSSNEYRETEIFYRTIIANDSSRYSPAQRKEGGVIGGEMIVVLGESDIAKQLDGRRYDGLVEELGRDVEMAAEEFLTWMNQLVNMALVEHNERQRWEAIVNAQVERRSEGGIVETVSYPDPSGHRVNAGSDWTVNTNDPWEDVLSMAHHLRRKGYNINRIVTSTDVMNTLEDNINTARRANRTLQYPDGSGNLQEIEQNVDSQDVAQVFSRNRLPEPETYDLNYREEDGTAHRFLPSDAMVFVCETGNDIQVRLDPDPTTRRILRDTLGYTAVGRPAGQLDSGRTVDIQPKSNKPPRIEAEGWQTSLPVLTNPEAVGVIQNITTV